MNGRPRSGSEHGNAWVMFLDQGHYRLSPRVQMWKSILAKIRPEPPKASLAPEGVGAETRTFTATKTLRAAASKATTMLKGSYPTRQ